MSLPRPKRVRRALIVCCHFARNLAYYRAGWNKKGLLVEIDFWRGVNGNCLDIAVLEWCKLFADRRDPHHWINVIENIDPFRTRLMEIVGGVENFDAYINKVKIYRDKFVAHLDSELTVFIPVMDDSLDSMIYYHSHMVGEAIDNGFIGGLPQNIKDYYDRCFHEARTEYERRT